MHSIFQQSTLAQQIATKLKEVETIKARYLKNKNNDALKDEYIKLMMACGKLFMDNKDLKNAEARFKEALQIAWKEHSMSMDISSQLLSIIEAQALGSDAAAAAKK